MRKLTLTLIFLISMVTSNICQVQILSGLVMEKDTEQTITGTHIILANGKTTISDSLGRFTIPVEKLPIVISISHLSNGLTEFTINQISNRLFVFKIQRVVNDLEEVQISAEKLRILTEKDDFSLQDIKHPSLEQAKKIESAIHQLGKELLKIRLV